MMLSFILCGSIIQILPSEVYSQSSYTPVSYRFSNIPASATPVAGTVSDGVCLSSDGYGNWFGEESKTLFLLQGDSLIDPSTSASPNIPSGLIQSGDLNPESVGPIVGEIKVTSNLVGNVRYVWPNSNTDVSTGVARNTFVVRGFNAVDGPNNMLGQQVDISCDGIPNAASSRDIVKHPVTMYTDIPTLATTTLGTRNMPVEFAQNVGGPSVNDLDWHDTYDICCDAVHLYVVWTYVLITAGTPMRMILVTAVNLSDNTPVPGFPKVVTFGFDDFRPTISCDVRNSNPSINSYMVAWVNNAGSGGNVLFALESSGTLLSFIFPKTYIDPNNHANVLTYQNPKHVRSVTGSVRGSSTLVRGIYVICNGAPDLNATTGDDLIFHKIIGSTAQAVTSSFPSVSGSYIDGLHIPTHAPPIDFTPSTTHFCPIVNQYIQAFGNPYDGEGTSDYDEFHCLYQLDDPLATAGFISKPLLIAGGHFCDNSPFAPRLEILTKNNTGVVITPLGSPVSSPLTGFHYLGSVNQMGIHVYWEGKVSAESSSTQFFYTRDQRSLDEPIEENTLLSYYNEVRDGNSHGGTLGATLQPGLTLTMWTDPNFNSGSLYLPPASTPHHHNCRLSIGGSGEDIANVSLQIGIDPVVNYTSGPDHQPVYTGYTSGKARLVSMPNFEVWFSDICKNSSPQSIKIRGESKWDYYGVPPAGGGKSNFFGSGSILPTGFGSIVPSVPPLTPANFGANILIHPGATLSLPDQVTLSGNGADIECLFGPHIRSVGTNPDETGVLQVHGGLNLHLSRAISHIGSGFSGSRDYLQILPELGGSGCTPLDPEFVSTTSVFSNIPGTQTSRITCSGNTSSTNYREVSIAGTLLGNGIDSAVNIDIADPIAVVTIDRNTFYNSQGTEILVHNDQSPSAPFTYDDIHITDNTFTLTNIDVTPIDFESMSLLRSSTFDKILVEGNTISTNQTASSTAAGIYFYNSTGKISSNIIDGNSGGLINGIAVLGIDPLHKSETFLCSNIITNCSNSGILTSYWNGIATLNSASGNDVGHFFADENVRPMLNINHYFQNNSAGLVLSSPSGNYVRMYTNNSSGSYINGTNTIENNNQLGSSATAEIEFRGGGFHYLDMGVTCSTSTVSGNNNVVRNTSSDQFVVINDPGTGGNLFKIFNDFWTTGTISGTPYPILASGDLNFGGVNYTCPNGATTAFSVSSPTCGDGLPSAIKYKKQPDIQSISSDTLDCFDLWQRVLTLGDANQYSKEYDSAKFFIEHCYIEKYATFGFDLATDGAIGLDKQGITLWAAYREWLKKVLYLSPDSNYYCKDILQYAGTFEFKDENGKGPDFKTALAIMKYIIDSSYCGFLRNDMNAMLNHYHLDWKDTVRDSLKTPFDTNYTSIDSLGQGFLHGLPNSVAINKYTIVNSIVELTAEKNPFTSEAVIHYVTNLPTVAKLEVYDALGHMLWTNGQGYLEAGNHVASIDGSQWSSGTYYVRLVTLKGEIKTCKLIKE